MFEKLSFGSRSIQLLYGGALLFLASCGKDSDTYVVSTYDSTSPVVEVTTTSLPSSTTTEPVLEDIEFDHVIDGDTVCPNVISGELGFNIEDGTYAHRTPDGELHKGKNKSPFVSIEEGVQTFCSTPG